MEVLSSWEEQLCNDIVQFEIVGDLHSVYVRHENPFDKVWYRDVCDSTALRRILALDKQLAELRKVAQDAHSRICSEICTCHEHCPECKALTALREKKG